MFEHLDDPHPPLPSPGLRSTLEGRAAARVARRRRLHAGVGATSVVLAAVGLIVAATSGGQPTQELRTAAPATTTTTQAETPDDAGDEPPETTTTTSTAVPSTSPTTSSPTSTTAPTTTTTPAATSPASGASAGASSAQPTAGSSEPVPPRDEGRGRYEKPAPPPPGVRVSLEMTTTETTRGGELAGVYILENTTDKDIKVISNTRCPMRVGLYQDGRLVATPPFGCGQAQSEEVFPAGAVRRTELTFTTYDEGSVTRPSEPLPPGDYAAAAGYRGSYDGDGDGDIDGNDPSGAWFAAPVRVTIRG